MALTTPLAVCATVVVSRAPAGAAVDLSRLQRIVEEKSILWNTSFSVGFYTDELGLQGAASGPNDRQRSRSSVSVHHRFPVGSVTKPFTAAAILQLHDSGYLHIDDPIAGYVDPILRRLNDTTMLELWGGDTMCEQITFRMLMGMRGGLQDYNDSWYMQETFFDGSHDVTPFELLHRLNKSWACTPGECGVYASTGFELLGLVLAEAAGVERWQEYDQRTVIPAGLRDGYPDLMFPGEGPCSLDPLIIHQYGTPNNLRSHHGAHFNPNTTVNLTLWDLYDNSCLNGWTCGNIAAAPSNVARFHYDLHNLRIVSNESLAAMMAFVSTTKGWSPQQYGLAMMQTFPLEGRPYLPDPENATYTVGHAGDDYGSVGQIAGYNIKYGFGIALFAGSANNMNCSMPSNLTVGTSAFFYDTACAVYDEVLQIVTKGEASKLNCSRCAPDRADYCMIRPPPPPSCAAFFNTTKCAHNTTIATNIRLCEECISHFRNNTNATAACPGKYGIFQNCQNGQGSPTPSPPVHCDWSHI
mmetsp:Transcript_26472/g.69640  ORF Transcript_26472/g.69640 Transcript_26472/m.69640 type:complete len:526 (+) Transcript_26472:165-1742(+)